MFYDDDLELENVFVRFVRLDSVEDDREVHGFDMEMDVCCGELSKPELILWSKVSQYLQSRWVSCMGDELNRSSRYFEVEGIMRGIFEIVLCHDRFFRSEYDKCSYDEIDVRVSGVVGNMVGVWRDNRDDVAGVMNGLMKIVLERIADIGGGFDGEDLEWEDSQVSVDVGGMSDMYVSGLEVFGF